MEDFTTPELSKISKENPFRVPDGYFDDFSARLQKRLEAEKKVISIEPVGFMRYLRPMLGLAASFGLIFLLVYWPMKSILPDKIADGNNSNVISTDQEYTNYVEGIDENSFYTLLSETSETQNLSDDDLVAFLSSNISEYEIFSQSQSK